MIQRITDLVMAEMGRGEESRAPVPTAPASSGRRVLLVPAPASGGEDLWRSLREAKGIAWTAVRVAGVCEQRFPEARWIDPPLLWDDLVHGCEAVVLPVLRLEVLSRIALLLSDIPAAAAAISAVMQGVPVLASAHEVDQLKRSSGRLPGPFLSLFHQHLRTVEGMGVQVLESVTLLQRLGMSRVGGGAATAGKGRDVITVSDLEAAARAGQKSLQVLPGTIVTPLAREKAAQMGIEVQFS